MIISVTLYEKRRSNFKAKSPAVVFRKSDEALSTVGIKPSTVPELLGQAQALQPLPSDVSKPKNVTVSTHGGELNLPLVAPFNKGAAAVQPPIWLLKQHGRQAEAAMGIKKPPVSTITPANPTSAVAKDQFVAPKARSLATTAANATTSSELSGYSLSHSYIMSVTGDFLLLIL